MPDYPAHARERAMKVQEILLRAISKQITFWQAAHILRYSPRHLRRVLERYRRYGFEGLYDRRTGRPSAKRVPLAVVEQVLELYREKYFDFSVQHFYEKLREEHGIAYSYTWVKLLLQRAGLVEAPRQRGKHRRKRERRPMVGMLLHIDASTHEWLGNNCWHDLIVVLDDATSQVYYAQLVAQESTATVLAALREVVEQQGLFCALYSDRASHFWLTPKEGEPVDRQRLTQVGRALRDLDITMIPAYSPQARGRSERYFRTGQGRLPKELRLHGITTLEAANRFLRETYIAELNRRFSVPPAQPGSAFLSASGKDLDRIFAVQHERVVQRDNTVHIANQVLQLEHSKWRGRLAGCRVMVCEHPDSTWSVHLGPHLLGRYHADGTAQGALSHANFPVGVNPAPPAGFTPTGALAPAEERITSGHITCS
jgi:transposase